MRKAQPKLTDICIADIREYLGREPRIYIVDDEQPLIEMYELAFVAVGYSVTTGQCTSAAGDHITEKKGHYDVVVSDFNNKGASGDEEGGLTLYQKLQREQALPPLYVFISGQRDLPLPAEVPFMRKPVGLYELAHRVTTEFRQRAIPTAGYTSPQAK